MALDARFSQRQRGSAPWRPAFFVECTEYLQGTPLRDAQAAQTQLQRWLTSSVEACVLKRAIPGLAVRGSQRYGHVVAFYTPTLNQPLWVPMEEQRFGVTLERLLEYDSHVEWVAPLERQVSKLSLQQALSGLPVGRALPGLPSDTNVDLPTLPLHGIDSVYYFRPEAVDNQELHAFLRQQTHLCAYQLQTYPLNSELQLGELLVTIDMSQAKRKLNGETQLRKRDSKSSTEPGTKQEAEPEEHKADTPVVQVDLTTVSAFADSVPVDTVTVKTETSISSPVSRPTFATYKEADSPLRDRDEALLSSPRSLPPSFYEPLLT